MKVRLLKYSLLPKQLPVRAQGRKILGFLFFKSACRG